MTMVNLDDELYAQVKEFVQKDKIEYPSINNFVERAVRDKLRIEYLNFKETQQTKEE